MDLNFFARYKDQTLFKITVGIIAFFLIIKIAMFGYSFGQWLKH